MRKISIVLLICLMFVLVGCSIVEAPTAGEVRILLSETTSVENDLEIIVKRDTGAEMSFLLKADEGYEKVISLDFGNYVLSSVRDITDTIEYEIEQIPFDLSESILKREIVLNISKSVIQENVESTDDSESIKETIASIESDVKESEPIEEPEETVEVEEETVVDDDTDILEEIKPQQVFTEDSSDVWVTESVNIRKEPNLDAEILGVFTIGQKLKRIGIGNEGWSKIEYNGLEVYCSSTYLTTTEPVSKDVFPMVYEDETSKITVTKEWYNNAWAYIAHLEFTDYSRLGTTVSNGKYNNGYETTSSVAKRLNAILTVNGCYSAPYLDYAVVRDGVIHNGAERALNLPAVYSKSNGLFSNAWDNSRPEELKGKTIQELVDAGLMTDSFCFGPPVLINGQITAGDDSSRAQRTFMGTNGNPGDIWIVVSDGRKNDGESSGLTYAQCAQLLLDKGCTFGICLDGGGSSTMVFQGKVLNANGANERAVVDFVYFK